MDKDTLRRVQLELLDILIEIDRVCKKNNIQYFLDSGTLIGAVRHKGFIPWDDDLDVGMLREDYNKFCQIAPKELGTRFFWQTWDTDPHYAIPFGKVRKRGTLYVEKKSRELAENGFYVDILPYDYAPNDEKERTKMKIKQKILFRCMLMKEGYRPWVESQHIDIKKRIGYVPFSIAALLMSRQSIIAKYKETIDGVSDRDLVYEQTGKKYYKASWMQKTVPVVFEGLSFPAVDHYHDWLTTAYGDYMTPPPVEERENRHLIYKLDFGE